MEVLKHIIIIYLVKFGLYKIPVKDLHRDYILGEMPLDGLYSFLQSSQIEAFIEHHNRVKIDFDKSGDMGLNKLDEISPELTNFINQNPELKAMIMQQGGELLSLQTRRRLFFALSQLDTVIENGMLEKRVKGKRKENLIGRVD